MQENWPQFNAAECFYLTIKTTNDYKGNGRTLILVFNRHTVAVVAAFLDKSKELEVVKELEGRGCSELAEVFTTPTEFLSKKNLYKQYLVKKKETEAEGGESVYQT